MNCKLFNRKQRSNERSLLNDADYIEVFDYLLFGVLPLTPWFMRNFRGFAEHFAHRRTYLVRRDSVPYLPKPQVLNEDTKGVRDEKI